jgi:O-methyltransferase
LNVRWLDTLREIVRGAAERTGYTIARTETIEERWAENAEATARLFAKVEGFVMPPDTMRSRLLASLLGTSISEALFILKYLHAAMAVEGEVCEFGVAQGATSALLANEIRSTGRQVWLFDSFAGLPLPSAEDVTLDHSWIGAMRYPQAQVQRRLQKIGFPQDRTHIVSGFFPASAEGNAPDRICFAYVDFDLYRPVLDALYFVEKRMPKGGAIVVDDYDHPLFSGVKKAVDEFVSSAAFDMLVPEHERFAILVSRADYRCACQ